MLRWEALDRPHPSLSKRGIAIQDWGLTPVGKSPACDSSTLHSRNHKRTLPLDWDYGIFYIQNKMATFKNDH